jgi:hypothetical protein
MDGGSGIAVGGLGGVILIDGFALGVISFSSSQGRRAIRIFNVEFRGELSCTFVPDRSAGICSMGGTCGSAAETDSLPANVEVEAMSIAKQQRR